MKSKLIGFLLLLSIMLGVFCAWQWRRLQAQLDRTRAVEEARRVDLAAREDLETKLKESERARARLEREVQEFAAVTAMLRSTEAKQSSNLTALARQFQPPGGDGAGDSGKGGLFGKGMGEMLGKMMKDPGMREMMRSQQKSVLNMMYGGLFKELNLPPEQKDKLMELLLDSQMKNIEAAQGLFGDDKGDGVAMAKSMNDQKKETEEKIKAMLGGEKFAQFDDYQKNIGERMQLNQLRSQLETQNLPMQDQQASQLLQIMKDEKARVPPVIPSDAGQVPENLKGMLTSENLEKQLQWMEDYNKRVLDRAGEVLSPEQVREFTDFQNQQASMQKLGLKMAREMFGSEKTGVGAPAPVAK